MAKKKWELNRRTFLKSSMNGVGVALGLPFLEAMMPEWKKAMAAGTTPRRFAGIFVPNGVNPNHWQSASTNIAGTAFPTTHILSPLNPHREHLLQITGLNNEGGSSGPANVDGPGDHARGCSTILTCQRIAKPGPRAAISLDQVIANQIGMETRFRSLELGGDNSYYSDSGYSSIYPGSLSWTGPTTSNPKEDNPARLFDSLFSGSVVDVRYLQKKSILDYVLSEANTLKSKLGTSDRLKIDEYLTSVREVERRIDFERSMVCSTPSALPPFTDWDAKVDLLFDLLKLAFQCDLTRTATFLMAVEGSGQSYPQIGVSAAHHAISHHQNNPDNLEAIRKINQHHVRRLEKFISGLKSIFEGEGTLLDNSIVVYGGTMRDGNQHDDNNIPIIVMGKGGGEIASGRRINAGSIPIANLYVEILNLMGIPSTSFGDSTGRFSI